MSELYSLMMIYHLNSNNNFVVCMDAELYLINIQVVWPTKDTLWLVDCLKMRGCSS